MPAMKIVRFENAEMGKSPLNWEIDQNNTTVNGRVKPLIT